jgi:hypothetical protein
MVARMPTKHRRYAVTETPEVRAALADLRSELSGERIRLGELVVLGATEKVRMLREERHRSAGRQRVADWIRTGKIPGDPEAARKARRLTWTHRT